MKLNPFTPPSHHHHKNRVDGTVSLHKVTFFSKSLTTNFDKDDIQEELKSLTFFMSPSCS